MASGRVIVAIAASVGLLAGCAPAPPAMPTPMSTVEAEQLVANRNIMMWSLRYPHEPMPVITPIEYQDPLSSDDLVQQCFDTAGVKDIVYSGGGWWTAEVSNASDADIASRAAFACIVEYPYDLSEPGLIGLLTDDERTWIWTYFQTRLVPCLQLMGYSLDNRSNGYIKGNGSFWNPYNEMTPTPTSAAEWQRVDRTCPPSPIGPIDRPTG